MTKSLHLFAPSLTLLLVACQPSPAPSATTPGAPPEASTSAGKQATSKVPLAVETFEMYCYQSAANYQRVVATAKALNLPPVPEKFMAVMGAQVGSGSGFVVVNDKAKRRMMLLGASDQNTCSVFAQGYDIEAIKASLVDNYHLKVIHREDLGLQINEMHIPNGVKGTVGEGSKYGMIGLVYPKDPAADSITISFVPPETAARVFSAQP